MNEFFCFFLFFFFFLSTYTARMREINIGRAAYQSQLKRTTDVPFVITAVLCYERDETSCFAR